MLVLGVPLVYLEFIIGNATKKHIYIGRFKLAKFKINFFQGQFTSKGPLTSYKMIRISRGFIQTQKFYIFMFIFFVNIIK